MLLSMMTGLQVLRVHLPAMVYLLQLIVLPFAGLGEAQRLQDDSVVNGKDGLFFAQVNGYPERGIHFNVTVAEGDSVFFFLRIRKSFHARNEGPGRIVCLNKKSVKVRCAFFFPAEDVSMRFEFKSQQEPFLFTSGCKLVYLSF